MAHIEAAARQRSKTHETNRVTASYSIEKIRNIFFSECSQVLLDLDSSLHMVSTGEVDRDIIEVIFRSIHLVHEGAAALELTELEVFARVFDNTLNKMCTDQLEMTHYVFQILLQSSDMLNTIFKAVRDNHTYDVELTVSLMHELENCITRSGNDLAQIGNDDIISMDDVKFQPIKLDFEFCTTPIPD